ncbi:MAG: MmgE/PrpD family protein [Desulfobacterales bacterium]|nr:MmgE/PrpD family protein [Desulfobacterales bacterium]
MTPNQKTLSFIRDTVWTDLPPHVQHQAKRCLMDALGALIAGHGTPVGKLMEEMAVEQFPGDQAAILVSGTRVSAAGAALANGFSANALDIDDGYRPTMGHPGACVLPPALTAAQLSGCSGAELITALALGYEIGTRAGLIRHATYETYHSSGSWGAVAGAAVAGKLLNMDETQLCHALGAAEYHAPIAPMMKCIEVPGMGKDSIGWGCMVGMMSVLMAQKGFTGINPLFDDTPEPGWVDSLGMDWEIMSLYFKPYSACRWAQPGVDGALKLVREKGILPKEIETIKVYTFEESAALSMAYPENTEEAQYNIAFPIAAALLDGEVGPGQNLPPRLFDHDIREIMDRISIVAEDRFQKNFPARAESEVEITTTQGKVFTSGIMSARWDAACPPEDQELKAKFAWLAEPVLGASKTKKLMTAVMGLERAENLDEFFSLCMR